MDNAISQNLKVLKQKSLYRKKKIDNYKLYSPQVLYYEDNHDYILLCM